MGEPTENKDKRPLILIVDDTPLYIELLAEALRKEYRIRVAGSGKAAFEEISKNGSPDLILLDVMMPEMDGYEVCRRLKRLPETSSVPVIFVTAKSDVLDEELGLKLGAADYITKPFHLPIVVARVKNHIHFKVKADLLESQAMLDSLTNIPNRRRFDETLEDEWKRAQRSSSPLSLIMADIDAFKSYNDNYGHGVGDDCLRKVAAALANSIERTSDLVARYGGEEFAVILPGTDAAGARIIAEHFRSNVEVMQIPHEYSETAHTVTVSVGVASCIPSIQTRPDELLKQADKMLYEAKKTGRNRVC